MDEGRTASAKTPAKDGLPAEVAAAIEAVLWSYWREALEGFLADEPGPDEGHIFRDLVAIDGWFHGHDAGPEELVAEFLTEEEQAATRRRVRAERD